MKLCCKVLAKGTFWLKEGGSIPVEDEMIYECEEGDEKYKAMCQKYEQDTGIKKEDVDANQYDVGLLKYVSEIIKSDSKKKVDVVVSTFKESCGDSRVYGYVSFGSVIVNIRCLSAIKIEKFETRILKG